MPGRVLGTPVSTSLVTATSLTRELITGFTLMGFCSSPFTWCIPLMWSMECFDFCELYSSPSFILARKRCTPGFVQYCVVMFDNDIVYVEPPNKGHFVDNINSADVSLVERLSSSRRFKMYWNYRESNFWDLDLRPL